MQNPRITKKERGLIKGALRRVFGRSDLRRSVIEAAIVRGYSNPKRKAVKFWVECTSCGEMEAKSNIQVDHVDPVIAINSSFDEMTLDEVVDRLWCDIKNLAVVCKPCHTRKSKAETKERARIKREKKTKS